jgi:NADP-dependent 3-hydroxy acid dehydrogenase YdfG
VPLPPPDRASACACLGSPGGAARRQHRRCSEESDKHMASVWEFQVRHRVMILGFVTITLITGANKGLGREAARRLLEVGHTVLLGARDAERGRRTAGELGAVFLEIDPTSDASVSAAAERVHGEYGRLDVLVNNAGTAEPRVGAADLTADEAMQGFGINVFGPIRVIHGFLPLLRASDNPRIVNVSSGVGSFTRILTPGTVENAVTLPVYPATKAALTMLTVQSRGPLTGSWSTQPTRASPEPTSTTTAEPRP